MTDEQAKSLGPGTPVWYADYVTGVGPVLKVKTLTRVVTDRDPSPWGLYCEMSDGCWLGASRLHLTEEDGRKGVALAIRGRIAVLEGHLRQYEEGGRG